MHPLALAFFLSVAADAPAAPPAAPVEKPAQADKPPPAPTEEPHPVPWFVPRTAVIGLFLSPNSSAWTPSAFFRVGWEAAILERPRNHLVIIVDVGSSTALSTPLTMKELYQHVAVVGLGYRSTHALLHWGFHVAAGPIWYRASYVPAAHRSVESRVLGWTEGRVQVGVKLAQNLVVAAYVGMGAPWTVDATLRYPANAYLGGLSLGFVVDWR